MLLRWAGRGTPRRGRYDAGRDGGLRLLGRLGLASLSSAFVLPTHCASPCLAEDCVHGDDTAPPPRWSPRRYGESRPRESPVVDPSYGGAPVSYTHLTLPTKR